MKRKKKRLHLSKETVVGLNGLRQLGGGSVGPTLWGDACAASEYTCNWGPCNNLPPNSCLYASTCGPGIEP